MLQSGMSCRTEGSLREAPGRGISGRRGGVSGHHSRALGRGLHLIKGSRVDKKAAAEVGLVLRPTDDEKIGMVEVGVRGVGMPMVVLIILQAIEVEGADRRLG
jgi:hypothetical protein